MVMRRIWAGWVRPYLGRLVGALLLMAVVAGSAAAYPLLTRHIFNALADGRAAEVIWVAPPLIILLALVKGVKVAVTQPNKKVLNGVYLQVGPSF